jgi:hypothetical protein
VGDGGRGERDQRQLKSAVTYEAVLDTAKAAEMSEHAALHGLAIRKAPADGR